MTIFYTYFFDKILAKYLLSKTHQIAQIFKIFTGEHAPEPPLANAWLRHANTPTFPEKF